MNKQELFEQVNGLPSTLLDKRVLIDKSAVLELVDQLEEPQKVVIPRFVDSFIRYAKDEGMSLFTAMDNAQSSDWFAKNEEIFARAWLDGYEVEQEKLYTVEIPSPNNPTKDTYILTKNVEGEVYLDVYLDNDDLWKNESFCQLTEEEIKKDFEWAWQFAEEVSNNDK